MSTRTRKPAARSAAKPARAADAPPSPTTDGAPRGVETTTNPATRVRPAVAPGGRRKLREKPKPTFLQAWGPLIAVLGVLAIAMGAVVLNAGVIPTRSLGTPTPVTLEDDAANILPPPAPTPRPEIAAAQQTAVLAAPTMAPAASGIQPTVGMMAPVSPQANAKDFPERMPVPQGEAKFPQLQAPNSNAGLASTQESQTIMNQARLAINGLVTMRERLDGRYYDPRTGEQRQAELYDIFYQSPEVRYRTGTFAAKFGEGVDITRPASLEVGSDYYKPEPDGSWLQTISRQPYKFPTANSVFGTVFNGSVLGEDTINGRKYTVVEYDQMGSDQVGAPGFRYRNRVWLDAETYLPFRLDKVSYVRRTATGSDANTYEFSYFATSLFDNFNVPVELPQPTNISRSAGPTATPSPR